VPLLGAGVEQLREAPIELAGRPTVEGDLRRLRDALLDGPAEEGVREHEPIPVLLENPDAPDLLEGLSNRLLVDLLDGREELSREPVA